MSETRHRGDGWGWVTCLLLAIGILIILAVIIFPLFAPCRSHRPDRVYMCMTNLNLIGKALEMYRSAWDDRMPTLSTTMQRAPESETWPDLIAPYLHQLEGAEAKGVSARRFRCPDCPPDRMNYSFNRRVQGLSVENMRQADTIEVFESANSSVRDNNLNGDAVSHPSTRHLPTTGTYVDWPSTDPAHYSDWPEWARMRHLGLNNVLYADGHVVSRDSKWSPSFDPKEQEGAK